MTALERYPYGRFRKARIVRMIRESGGLELARSAALAYVSRAREAIARLPAIDARDGLEELAKTLLIAEVLKNPEPRPRAPYARSARQRPGEIGGRAEAAANTAAMRNAPAAMAPLPGAAFSFSS